MALNRLTEEQEVDVTLAPETAAGNPAKVDGKPTWNNSNPTVVALTIADDGMSAVVSAVGPVGTAQISAKVDADLGSGVRELFEIQEFEVVAAEAVSVGLSVGTPRLKPVV